MERKMPESGYTIALLGNPNVGKSTVFNALTGLHQHTGNWPGKTVSAASGAYDYAGVRYELVDLPGTYSMICRSQEEAVTVQWLRRPEIACTVVVCDATCLARNLTLVLQAMEVTPRLVVCLNLMDEAKKRGIETDVDLLADCLGVPVVSTAASRGEGLEALRRAVRDVCDGFAVCHPRRTLGQELSAGQLLCGATQAESDAIAAAFVRRAGQIASQVQPKKCPALPWQQRLDRLLIRRATGIPIMLGLLFLVFWLTMQGANYPSAALERLFEWFGGIAAGALARWNVPAWLRGLLMDGVYSTVTRVVAVMLPPMAIFFPLFTLLEDFGLLPRIAFLLDHSFSRCGACGKQALTCCMGFGCNAVGVTGCRIIDSPRERLMAILTNAFIPCNGRFPAMIVLLQLFFAGQGRGSGLLAAALLTAAILLSLAMSMLMSAFLHHTALRGKTSAFTLELPPYRRPKVLTVIVRSLLDRTIFVLGRAVAVAAPAGVVIWALGYFTAGGQPLLLWAARALEPLGAALGMSGPILLAFVLGFPANELVLPVLLMVLSAAGIAGGDLAQTLRAADWTWMTAACVLVFYLFHWPCSTTVLTIHRETGSWKWTALAVALPTGVGVVCCALLHGLLRLLAGI